MNKEAAKILYDIDLCARFTEKVAKNGHKYLRVDYEDLHKDINSGQLKGTTCFLVFVNEDNIRLKEYEYRFYKPRHANTNQQHSVFDTVKKMFVVGQAYRLSYRVTRDSLVFTKTKAGAKRVLIKSGRRVAKTTQNVKKSRFWKNYKHVTKTYDITASNTKIGKYSDYIGRLADRLYNSRKKETINPMVQALSSYGLVTRKVNEREICRKIIVDKVLSYVNEHWDSIDSLKVKRGKKRKVSRKSK